MWSSTNTKKVLYLLELARLINVGEKREHVCEVQKAKQMGKDLLQECSDDFLIDPNSAHKPTQKRKKGTTQNGRKKIARITQMLEMHQIWRLK